MHNSKYFLWDKFNIGLDTHFYTHGSILETMGNPQKKYAWFIEPRSITPNDYKIFKKNKGLEKEFTAVLTFDEQLLNSLNNAFFLPYCASIFVGISPEKTFSLKTKNLSMICSNKRFTKHHKLRHTIAHIIKNNNLGDTFGQFDGSSRLENKIDSLKNYRYHIAVENGVFDYYFTEKLLDCFATLTIPIYFGATKISEFFNMDGIIVISEKDIDELPKILQQCNEKDYISKLPAIRDNYQRVLKYANLDDYLYKKLFK